MSYVINETKKVMRKALLRFAKDLGINPSRVQIVIFTKENNLVLPSYRLYVDFKPLSKTFTEWGTSEITFLQILGVEFDFVQKEEMATPFLANALERFSHELKAEPKEVAIMVLTQDDEKAHPLLLLKKGTEDVKQLDFKADIFMMPDDVL